MLTGMTRFLTSNEVKARKEQIINFFNEYVNLCNKYNCVLIEEGWWANSIEEFASHIIPENKNSIYNDKHKKFKQELFDSATEYFDELECHCETFFDKNGVKLKDGDIVLDEYKIPYKVEKHNYCWVCHGLTNFLDNCLYKFGNKKIEKINVDDYPKIKILLNKINKR